MSSPVRRVVTAALIPPPWLVAELVVLSEELGRGFASEIVLGPETIPHVTIVQWADADPRLLRRRLAPIATGSVGTVTFAGLTVVPWVNGDHWLEIQVLKQDWLRDLQARCLEAADGLGTVVNDVGDGYRPHLTLCMTYDSPLQLPELPRGLIRGATPGWSIHLGVSGDHLTLKEVLPWEL